jgi:hypothetical protein
VDVVSSGAEGFDIGVVAFVNGGAEDLGRNAEHVVRRKIDGEHRRLLEQSPGIGDRHAVDGQGQNRVVLDAGDLRAHEASVRCSGGSVCCAKKERVRIGIRNPLPIGAVQFRNTVDPSKVPARKNVPGTGWPTAQLAPVVSSTGLVGTGTLRAHVHQRAP